MGNERRSRFYMREAGKICTSCNAILPEPISPGAKLCPRCVPKERCLMCFELKGEMWHVRFRTVAWARELPRVLHFRDSSKIRDLYMRFGASHLSEDVCAFDYAVRQGKGIVDVDLGTDQLQVLKQADASLLRKGPHRAGEFSS